MSVDKPLYFDLPDDPKVLAAIGAIAIRHGQLDNALCLAIGSVAGVDREQALYATSRQSSRELRERLRKLARQRFGDGAALVNLEALLERARLASEGRNEVLHSVWAKELDGDAKIRDEKLQFKPIPSIGELEKLASDLNEIRQRLLFARQEGFLAIAINATTKSVL